MDYNKVLTRAAFGVGKEEKQELFSDYLSELTAYHREHCPAYERYLSALGYAKNGKHTEEDIPMVPISVFKEMDLCSVPEEEVFKTITSSGTTGQKVSKIYLDSTTAANQQKTLYKIVADFTGGERLPFLIIDSPKVLKDRMMFSARGAGILGFSIFASEMVYALDDDMNLNLEAIAEFTKKYQGKKVLLFGFTYMIWKHFYKELEQRDITLDFPAGMLIHGGGWKKLQAEAVDNPTFKDCIKKRTGIDFVSNYYGMAEQTGCIYMECEEGHLHVSTYSDILIRRAEDFSICNNGEEGIIQVLSLLPESYPGHSILTEDRGVILGEDDCPCGRKGKYFSILGRVKHSETRGCSDTYEG